MLTDRDERALVAAAENRISEPLRRGAAAVSVRNALAGLARLVRLARRTRLTRGSAQERESMACQPTPTTTPLPH
ncbi:hypothetical protein ABZX75_22955 [Streptomyces sp. NPDC003038]|uniref:hypothetical protein n=1 Tax=unclassified Streptomyces TaxID=2593676 RepID=UPI00339FD202